MLSPCLCLCLSEDVGASNVSVFPSEENFRVGPSCDWLHWDQLHVDGYSFKTRGKAWSERRVVFVLNVVIWCERVGNGLTAAGLLPHFSRWKFPSPGVCWGVVLGLPADCDIAPSMLFCFSISTRWVAELCVSRFARRCQAPRGLQPNYFTKWFPLSQPDEAKNNARLRTLAEVRMRRYERGKRSVSSPPTSSERRFKLTDPVNPGQRSVRAWRFKRRKP